MYHKLLRGHHVLLFWDGTHVVTEDWFVDRLQYYSADFLDEFISAIWHSEWTLLSIALRNVNSANWRWLVVAIL